ncbi:MAG: glycosyltransferase family 9 protein [Chloroflexota bacterium]
MNETRRAIRLALLRIVGRPLAAYGRIALSRAARGSAPASPAPDPPPDAAPGPRLLPRRPPRILLIRPDHLGDVLLASPAAEVVRRALPDAEIDWLVGPWSAEMARRSGGAATVLTLDFPGFTRQPKRSALEPYRLLMREATRLRTHAFDAAVILRPDHWWGAMLAAAAGIPRRFGYSLPECTPFLTDTLPPPTGSSCHAVQANQALARLAAIRLGRGPVGKWLLDPDFTVAPDELHWARTWIAAAFVGGRADGATVQQSERVRGGPVVAIHPGTGAVLKNWLPDRWSEVTRALRVERDARIFLTGGPGDREVVEAVAARLSPRPPVLVGETTLGQLAALFASSDLVLGCDSGPLHLAAAVGARTVRLYGPTDPVEFGPWTPRGHHGHNQLVAASLPCQPCRAVVGPPCGATREPACMVALSVSAVTTAALACLDGPTAPVQIRRVEAPAEQPAGVGDAPC